MCNIYVCDINIYIIYVLYSQEQYIAYKVI